jgi:hypothetical protein
VDFEGGHIMHADREHVISVVLTHDDWKEFVKLQPRPADWLRERIQEMIATQSGSASPMPAISGRASSGH